MNKVTLEIRAAEGGDDSKSFMQDLMDAYFYLADKRGWKCKLLTYQEGIVSAEITGCDVHLLMNECGGHRIQRIPKNEKRGRVHTSTVTVAVLDGCRTNNFVFRESDVKVEWYSGSGAGGQHRNKHQNCCRLTHIPTGTVETAQSRSRKASFDFAMSNLKAKLIDEAIGKETNKIAAIRQEQVGSGMRGDKIRTYQFKYDIVKDHMSGKSATCKEVMNGDIDLLW